MRWLISSIQTRFGHGRQTQPRMIQNIGSCPLDDSIVHDGRPAGSHCSLRTNSCTTGGKRSASRSRKSKMVPLQSSTLILCGATRKPGQNSVGSVGRARSTRRSMNGGSSFTRPAYLSTRGEALPLAQVEPQRRHLSSNVRPRNNAWLTPLASLSPSPSRLRA